MMSGKKTSTFMHFILHGAILVSFVKTNPVSLASRQVGLSDDVQVLTVNGSQDCEHGGKIYHNGDHFKDPSDPCSTCQCSGGDVNCSVILCPPSPSEECKEVKEEGKCCSSYVCPAVSEVTDDQRRNENELVDTTTLPEVSEADDKTEDPSFDQAQNAVNSLFIHKVILETIKKEQEQEQVESTVATLTELPASSQEVSESIQTSTLSENYEADEFVASTTLESVSEMDTTSELPVEENLIREVSDVSTIRSETITTFDATERSAQEENEIEQSLVTEDSFLNEEISDNASEPRETTEISTSDKNIENEANVSATEKQLLEVNEEATPSSIDTFYRDKTEELFTTEAVAEATEISKTKDEEAETSVPEIENLIKAAESVLTSQTETYLEENSSPERSNAMETTPYYEERDVSTSNNEQVAELPEQTTELQPLEPRSSDNQVSTISNTEILDESDGESSALLFTETPLDINTVRNIDHASPTELSDEIPITTSNYENNNQKDDDTDLLYVFEEDRIAQASKSQKSESINIEEISKYDNEIVEGTTIEAVSSTPSNTDTRSASYGGETTTVLDLVDGEAVTTTMEEAEIENSLRFDNPENSVNEFEGSSAVTSGDYITEVYSTTVLSEDAESRIANTENALGVNSARKESIDETATTPSTSEIASEEDEFILTEESTTQSGAIRLLDEVFISTAEKSEAVEDNWETTKIPDVRQESEILTTTLSNKKENEDIESKIESIVETKSENASGKSNATSTDTEVKSQEKTAEKSEVVEDNWETTETPNVQQESEILTKTLSNRKENEEVEGKIESVVETKPDNTSEKSNETVIENKEKSNEETTEKSETEERNWDTTEIPQVQESKLFTETLSNKKENENVESKVESIVETKLESTSEESEDEPVPENKVKSQEKTLAESKPKLKRKDSNIHVFEKILSNGSVTKIETHSSEDRKSPKMDRISTQFHHLARKYGLRPLTRKTFKDDVKNRRRYRLSNRKSLFEDKQ